MRTRELSSDVVTTIPRDHKLAGRWKLHAGLAVLGLILAVVGAMLSEDGAARFFHSYLVAFMYCLSLALGGLFFVLVQFLVRAGWSVVVRRVAENLMGTLPIFLILFVPIAIGLHHTHHHWMAAHGDPILEHKSPYLNLPFFYIRAAIYFGLWIWLSMYFRGRSVEQDRTGDHELTRRMQKWSGPSIALFALTLTFASIDWVMSMDPHWYSTMFGVYYFSGAVLAMFATVIVFSQGLQRTGLLGGVISTEHYHDLGKFLFGFVVFWTYISFSQYFLIWYANIPEETLWYQHRTAGSWHKVALFLMAGHFFVPFFYLLPRTVKRMRGPLLAGAIWILVVHYVDLYWVIMPMLDHHGVHPSLTDLGALLLVGGVFLAAYAWLAAKDALIPIRDPRLPESIAFENF